MPTLYVIAGPNGVGKTTFADRYLPDTVRQFEFVNADLIARGLSPYDPDSVAMEAGRIALKRIRDLIAARQSFTWETTLSGRSATVWLADARRAGYLVKAYFLWVRNVELTLARIQERVIEGGHDIPVEVARRRFFKTVQNLFAVYRALFDSWKLIENDGTQPRLIAVEKEGKLAVRDRARFAGILNEAGIGL